MGLQLDELPLMLSQSVADTADVANGTPRDESRRYAGREARLATARSARKTRPSRLRVGTTLIADELAILAASLLAVWVAGAFDDVPLISRLIAPASRSSSCSLWAWPSSKSR